MSYSNKSTRELLRIADNNLK